MQIELKKIRKNLNLTQAELSAYLNIPQRTIENWEEGKRTPSDWTYNLIIDALMRYQKEMNIKYNDEEGIYSFSMIKSKVAKIATNYDINKIILFGSYSKGLAHQKSDIDLYIETPIRGLAFFGILEDLVVEFNKQIDLIKDSSIDKSSSFYQEIMEKGITIYERLQ